MNERTDSAPAIHYTDTSIGFFPFVLAIICGVTTGVLWAYANPIQLVPGVIQWRIFAFLPPLIGLLLGPKSGFITGYAATIVWALLAGTFIPAHSLIVDGIMVGLTGLIPPYFVNLRKIDFNINLSVLVKVGVICLVTGLIMVAAVSASLAFLGIFPFWFAMLYLGLSDIVPMVIGTPLLLIPGLRILASVSRGSLNWF